MPNVELARRNDRRHNFYITMDKDAIFAELDQLSVNDSEYEDEDEEGNEIEPHVTTTENPTKVEAVAHAKAYLTEKADWDSLIDLLDKKKDGSFAIGRQHTLLYLEEFEYESESHYGHRIPRLQLKTVSSEEATVEFTWYTRKW